MSYEYSFETGQRRPLQVIDYVLFSMLFVASASIGFYHAWRGRNKATEYEFNFAGRTLHPVPVSMSLAATFFSAVTILGVPAEVYTNNSMFLWSLVANLITTIFVAHVYAPFFHKLNITSLYEYIEKRFCRALRLLASSMFFLQYIIYLGLVLYLPCLTLQAVTGVSQWTTMIVVAIVCTLYTILGGMRSVVWVDTLQLTIIIAGLVVAFIGGANATGGIQNAWRIAQERNRITFDELSVDPRTRHSVWALTIGYSTFQIYIFGLTQLQIQRICTLPTPRKVTIAVWLSFPWYFIIQTLVCFTGIIMFAFYSDCHPVEFGIIDKNDQLMPLFVLDVMGKLPGMPGLFLACVFSGCLSTISSCLNTLSTVILEDFVKPYCCKRFAAKNGLRLSRFVVFAIGCVMFVVAVLASEMGSLILQLSTSFQGMLVGPIMGLFLSGMFLPWTNSKGAAAGFLVSLLIVVWLVIGTLIEKPSGSTPLSTSVSGCNWNASTSTVHNDTLVFPGNATYQILGTTSESQRDEPLVYDFYRISYLWYSSIGTLVNLLVTLVVSFITGCTDPTTLDSRLICPVFDTLFPWLPERVRRSLRCGIVYSKKYNVDLSVQGRNNKETPVQVTSLIGGDG